MESCMECLTMFLRGCHSSCYRLQLHMGEACIHPHMATSPVPPIVNNTWHGPVFKINATCICASCIVHG